MERYFSEDEIRSHMEQYLFEISSPETLERALRSMIELIGPGNNVAVVFHEATNSLDVMFDETDGSKRVVTVSKESKLR